MASHFARAARLRSIRCAGTRLSTAGPPAAGASPVAAAGAVMVGGVSAMTTRPTIPRNTPKALHRIETDFMAALRRVKPDAQIAAAAH